MARRSMKEAIRAFCIHCMGGSKTEVLFCTATKCELYYYRLGDDKNGNTVPADKRL